MTRAIIVIGLVIITIMVGPKIQLAYSWPAGTTEADKDKILTARSMDDLSVEEFGIAEDRMYEFFDAYSPGTKEYQDLLDCGFVDKNGFEILQCLEGKGHPVR